MKKKILFILHIPPPVNGAAIVGQLIQKSDVVNECFDCDYINLTTSFSLNKIGKGTIGKFLTIVRIVFQVIKALIGTDYNLCYMTLTAKGPGFYKDFLIVLVLKMFGKNVIFHFHNKGIAESGQNWFNDLLYRITFQNAKCILLSPLLYSDVSRYIPEEHVYYCANGIPDVEVVQSLSKQKERNGAICRLLFLSNMMEEKGVLVLLEACRLLKNKKLEFECHFIGDWSDISRDFFLTKVSSLDIADRIFAHGKKYGNEKLGFFGAADVFVFPTYYHNECFPLVLIEAMQQKLPVIATPEGGIPDLVKEGESGILVPQKDSKALAIELERLIFDVELRLEMGNAGRKRYERLFTYSAFANNLKDILHREVSEKILKPVS